MSDNLKTNINLAKKIKKLGSRQEAVLAGVADQLTEEEKANITIALGKMDQLSNNIKIEDDKPTNQTTSGAPNFEAFFSTFRNELHAYEESDRMDSLMFSSGEYLQFKTSLYDSFDPMYYKRFISQIYKFEGQANRVLLFLAADRGFIYSKMKEDCLLKNITWREYLAGQKLSYTTVNNHIQFYDLVELYPRVLISGATKTEWFKFTNQFKGAIKDDESMKTRLAVSLKEFLEQDGSFEDACENIKT